MNKEIIWNIVNSLLAGSLIFLGALSDGGITKESVILALVASSTIAILQFKKYWEKEESDYRCKTLGTFL
jgi:hypothetical protein